MCPVNYILHDMLVIVWRTCSHYNSVTKYSLIKQSADTNNWTIREYQCTLCNTLLCRDQWVRHTPYWFFIKLCNKQSNILSKQSAGLVCVKPGWCRAQKNLNWYCHVQFDTIHNPPLCGFLPPCVCGIAKAI